MNFNQKYFNVYATWVEQQMQAGQGLFEAVQEADSFDPSLIWDKTLDAYQAAIQSTLDAEVASARLYFEDVAEVEYLPEEALKMVDYFKDITGQITSGQQDLVDNGFKLLRNVDVNGPVIEQPVA